MSEPSGEGVAYYSGAEYLTCEHHWVSSHQPDFPDGFYWIRQCSQCHTFDADVIIRQVRDIRRRALIEAAEWAHEEAQPAHSNIVSERSIARQDVYLRVEAALRLYADAGEAS